MSVDSAEALQWDVDGLVIAGLSWGTPGSSPVLALHGWLDNAASFSKLGPLLEDHHVVAIDLTGHGMSARRSADASYQIWDDLPQICAVVDRLGWQQFDVLGHSRGAIIAALLAAARPERVKHLVQLDAVAPSPVAEQEMPVQLGRFLDERNRLTQRKERLLASVEEGVALRESRGLSRQTAEILVPRSLRSLEGGYRWTNDPRLTGASAVKLTQGHIDAALAAIRAPTLLLLADDGHGRHPEILETAQRNISNLRARSVKGSHHFHIDGDVQGLARQISEFFQEDNV